MRGACPTPLLEGLNEAQRVAVETSRRADARLSGRRPQVRLPRPQVSLDSFRVAVEPRVSVT